MKKETAVAAIIVVGVLTFVGGYILGNYGVEPGEAGSHTVVNGFDSNIVPLGQSPIRGDEDAEATVVFFADLTVPSSVAAAGILQDVMEDERFEGHVRLVVKFLPGRGTNSERVAAAGVYAAENGDFFDGFYESIRSNADDIEGALSAAGADPGDFNPADFQSVLTADENLAMSLGITSAPAIVVNGRVLTGDRVNRQPINEAVFGEIDTGESLIQSGVSAEQLYAARVRGNTSSDNYLALGAGGDGDSPGADREDADPHAGHGHDDEGAAPTEPTAAVVPRDRPPATPPSDDVERLRIDVSDLYVRGAADAPVTIVEVSDFHCPYCSRVQATIDQLFDEYGTDVRIAFLQNPLPMHSEAPLAHDAALAAGEQGMFWEFHDAIFENNRARSREDLVGMAADLGLDVPQFEAYLDSEQGEDAIEADQAVARRVNARGTPHFFINGRRLRGAQPVDRFQEIIDSELALAQQLMADGTARADIYSHLMEGALDEPPAEEEEAPAIVEEPEVGDSFARGNEDAAVTIFVFSEFQCPFCSRALPTITEVDEEYGDQVRWVFKSFPLPFHDNAQIASEAAYAAGEQGMFWEYHDILFDNQRALSRADLEGYAEQLGLDMAQFNDALDSGRFTDQITAETAEGRAAGVSGTPTFLINGERLVGAVPFSRFQPIIERHLSD